MDIWTKLAVFAFFETPKVILRPFRYEDHWDFYSMVNDTKNLYYVFPEQKTKASQKVAKKAGFQLKTCFKGSDRNTHKICIYKMYQLTNDR